MKSKIELNLNNPEKELVRHMMCEGMSEESAIDIAYFCKHELSGKKPQKGYVCSPCNDKTRSGIIRNMKAARKYSQIIESTFNVKARAPHAWLPEILDDHDEADRKIAISVGIQMLKDSQVVYVCGNRISRGMANEIRIADKMGLPIIVFNPDVLLQMPSLAKSFYGYVCTDPCTNLGWLAKAPEEV